MLCVLMLKIMITAKLFGSSINSSKSFIISVSTLELKKSKKSSHSIRCYAKVEKH